MRAGQHAFGEAARRLDRLPVEEAPAEHLDVRPRRARRRLEQASSAPARGASARLADSRRSRRRRRGPGRFSSLTMRSTSCSPAESAWLRPSAARSARVWSMTWTESDSEVSSITASGPTGMPTASAACSIERCRHALGQHRRAFHDEGAEHPAGEEAARIVDDDRRLADRDHVVVGAGDRLVAGLLAADDLDQPHLVHRREEVQADEALGRGAGRGQAADRQRRGVAGEHAAGREQRLGLARHLGLQRPVLEHRLDDQLAAVERRRPRPSA